MLGGIIFRDDFRYLLEDGSPFPTGEERWTRRVPMLDYKMRLSPEFVNTDTDLLFPVFQLSGPGFSGEQDLAGRLV